MGYIFKGRKGAIDTIRVTDYEWHYSPSHNELYRLADGIFEAYTAAGGGTFHTHHSIKAYPKDAVLVEVEVDEETAPATGPETPAASRAALADDSWADTAGRATFGARPPRELQCSCSGSRLPRASQSETSQALEIERRKLVASRRAEGFTSDADRNPGLLKLRLQPEEDLAARAAKSRRRAEEEQGQNSKPTNARASLETAGTAPVSS